MSYQRVSKSKNKKFKQKSAVQTTVKKSPVSRWKQLRKTINTKKLDWWETMKSFWQSLTNNEKSQIMSSDDFASWDYLKYAKMDKPQACKSLLTKKDYDGFLTNKTGMSLYDDMFDPEQTRYYEVAKDIHYVLIEMTADEYLKEVYRMFLKFDGEKYTTWESATGTFPESVAKYSKMMKGGIKFNMPMIDWKRGGQEGRNRAVAFKKTFGEKAIMPVMILKKYSIEKREPIYAQKDDDE